MEAPGIIRVPLKKPIEYEMPQIGTNEIVKGVYKFAAIRIIEGELPEWLNDRYPIINLGHGVTAWVQLTDH